MEQIALRRAVDEEFAMTGAQTPPWPDPHRDAPVTDEEYSRCLDPGKYRILAARVEAWTRVLTRFGLARAEPVDDPKAVWRSDPGVPVTEAVRLSPVRGGAVPLVVGFSAIDQVPRTITVLGAGAPAVALERLPDCGCDACDDGSANLLEMVDDAVLAVVQGSFTHVDAGRGRRIVALGDDWSATDWDGSLPPVAEALAAARADRSPYEVVRGTAWDDTGG
ncbi:hypothetical protein G3I40_10385 [Streptomyces sp. SID14478]|uniref:DUF6226 family protein n=1 Tax=Streptomyces sp. SID14478 TaxID=2706073 RepID=UPI0013DB02F3|nr:DUF6226 family protein [Streptomyces sp. SID14478]NEB75631.1 hypothetical protein [Streptomyces sp. SID14478]